MMARTVRGKMMPMQAMTRAVVAKPWSMARKPAPAGLLREWRPRLLIVRTRETLAGLRVMSTEVKEMVTEPSFRTMTVFTCAISPAVLVVGVIQLTLAGDCSRALTVAAWAGLSFWLLRAAA